jgi:hypothetical protein
MSSGTDIWTVVFYGREAQSRGEGEGDTSESPLYKSSNLRDACWEPGSNRYSEVEQLLELNHMLRLPAGTDWLSHLPHPPAGTDWLSHLPHPLQFDVRRP